MRYGQLISGIIVASVVVTGCGQAQSTPPTQQSTTQVTQTSTPAPTPNPELDKQLVKAVEANDPATVESLLKQGANPNTKDDSGEPLLLTTAFGSTDRNKFAFNNIAKILLEYKSNPNATSSQGDSVLYWAAYNGNTELVKMLLEAGADPNGKYRDGSTAIQAAEPFPEIVSLLQSKQPKNSSLDTNNGNNVGGVKLLLNGVDSSYEHIFQNHFPIVQKAHLDLIYRRTKQIKEYMSHSFTEDRPDLADGQLSFDAKTNTAYFTYFYSPRPNDLDLTKMKGKIFVKIAAYHFISEFIQVYFQKCADDLAKSGIDFTMPKIVVEFKENDNKYLVINRGLRQKTTFEVKLPDQTNPIVIPGYDYNALIYVKRPHKQLDGTYTPEGALLQFFNHPSITE
ncbi:ankyrin repeat domain-containing protein [Brevibacillus sp. GCM10020057]|uniref:ankyrin repeat domain-containing protein n=1 Tax=Brevibacillus sp. GCM10020057 TaxID=3317327 RepID=UPI00363AA91A